MSERQAGWYWVKGSKAKNAAWIPALWDGDDWNQGVIADVGPRIPAPGEPWQTVPVGVTPPMRRAGQHALEHQCYIDGIYADIIAAAPKP